MDWFASGPKTVFGPGEAGEWDYALLFVTWMTVQLDAGTGQPSGYTLWYGSPGTSQSDRGWKVGCATSKDLITWDRCPDNPVLPGTPGAWDEGTLGACVLHEPEGEPPYKMWYGGERGNIFQTNHWSIGYATSTDGRTFIKSDKNPVLQPLGPGTWEEASLAFPNVIHDTRDGAHPIYRMWYTALSVQGCGSPRIGYADSKDGIAWRRYSGNPVLVPDTSEISKGVDWAKVLFDPSTEIYEMWYTGFCGGGHNYATSLDGITWTKYQKNPLSIQGGFSELLTGPVYYDGTLYHMIYNRYAGEEAGYATSSWTIPKASFKLTPEVRLDCRGEVEADALLSSAPNGVESYAWDFGDGSTATGVKATNTYLRGGRYIIRLTVVDSGTLEGGSAVRPVNVGCCKADVQPWTSADIGAPSVTGGARWEGEGAGQCMVLCAGGKGIGGDGDEFHFVYQEVTGDACLTAKLSTIQSTQGSAKAGLMFRETLGEGSRHGFIFVQPQQVRLLSRAETGGRSTQTSRQDVSLPIWVRIERAADRLTGSSSPDGNNWSPVGEVTLDRLPERVYVGIAAAGSDTSDASQAFQPLEASVCSLALTPRARGPQFRRGDTDGTGSLSVTDAIVLLGYLFLGSGAPGCEDAADADDDGKLQITDAVFTLGYLFLGTRPPPAPGPDACGTDPTEDSLRACSSDPAGC